MEWIFYGFFGVLGLIVAAIIGIGAYTAFLGKGKNMANMGPRVTHDAGNVIDARDSTDSGPSGGGAG